MLDALFTSTHRRSGALELTAEAIGFIQAREGFVLATLGSSGWPWVVYRSGPVGFVQHLEGASVGWAEFTATDLADCIVSDNAMALVFVDRASGNQLKLTGNLQLYAVRDRPDLALRLALDDCATPIALLAEFELTAFEWRR